MSRDLTKTEPKQRSLESVEAALVQGDLSKLSTSERVDYYNQTCQSLGLNPLTKPFDYITLNGKLQLYARKDATEQLRKIYKVSIIDLAEKEVSGVYVVTAKAQDGSGRCDMAKGAVTIANLKGDALANAIMKAETKAKRRVTLSICGLGMLDETEVDTIPSAKVTPLDVSSLVKPADQIPAKPVPFDDDIDDGVTSQAKAGEESQAQRTDFLYNLTAYPFRDEEHMKKFTAALEKKGAKELFDQPGIWNFPAYVENLKDYLITESEAA